MINLFSARLEGLSLHRVGNKNRGESLYLSSEPCKPDDETNGLLKEYFLKPFREKEEHYLRFAHEQDLEFHEVYRAVSEIFTRPESLHEQSAILARHLYAQSVHPHIKSGELFIGFFTEVVAEQGKTQAIGIFKSELKHDFLQFREAGKNLDLLVRQGVNINKLDKGCLIFNLGGPEGYKILSVDSNRYDARYWVENFLGSVPLADEHFYTRNYLKFCKDFARNVVLPAEDKQQEVLFMNRAIDHFAKNDAFEETQFLNEVLENPDLIPEFKHYKLEKGPRYSIEDVSDFDIANTTVSDVRKKMKHRIHLDTHIQIGLDFINPESASKYVEKGWDEERQMYYYLLYFNKEQKI